MKHVSQWFKPALGMRAAKAHFTQWNGYFDQQEFDKWIEDARHPPQILFPDGLVRCELSSFEAKELVSLLRGAMFGHTILSPEHSYNEILPNFLRCEFVNGRINSELILTLKYTEDTSGDERVMFRGHFQEGIPHGHFLVFDASERINEEYELAYGINHGNWIRHNEETGTRIESIEYRYNQRHGKRCQYHRSGRLKTVANYEHDKRVGPQQYFEDTD
ncbi:hypothetical protein N9V47_05270 [Luminiphilus sp.]|nr:hypothetical protein [Luminiphilus sp.]MDB2313047.1 hypothetical protein [Luminiphilus sp.]